jgi:hypothetical protein
MSDGWPRSELSDVARLRVLAAGLPGVVVHERLIDVEFERVWGFVSDVERAVPRFDDTVDELRVLRRADQRMRVRVTWTLWRFRMPVYMDVVLRDGWCWMVSRPGIYVVGMAAEADGHRTRFALLEGLAFGAPRPVSVALRPLLAVMRWRHRRHTRRDVDGIERMLRN